jgi:hypothetical protein
MGANNLIKIPQCLRTSFWVGGSGALSLAVGTDLNELTLELLSLDLSSMIVV